MFTRYNCLETPENFSFPFQPYDIQQNLMKNLYKVIENKQIGIFESPTGTGKSLTLTCGALKWLLDHESSLKVELSEKVDSLQKEVQELEISGATSSDWIVDQFAAITKKDELGCLKKTQSIIEEYEKSLQQLKEKKEKDKLKLFKSIKNLEEKLFEQNSNILNDGEDDFELEEYEDHDKLPSDEEDNITQYKDVKIFFCSRTHSQLSQVVNEIKRTVVGKQVRCVSLASRQNLCINPTVRKLASTSLINEKCLDLQKSQSKATSTNEDGRPQKKSRVRQSIRCPYKNQETIKDLRDISLLEVLDIEDLVGSGESLKACPYYSGRAASKDAQVILLPYQMLLHRKTRLQTGIDLKNSVLIIDEAHNLLDTISSIYSAEISLEQIQIALEQLISYKTKYFNRFGTKNLLKINQLIFVTKRLTKLLSVENYRGSSSRMILTHELMAEGEFFNINIFDLLEFCEQTRFAQKVHGLAVKISNDPEKIEDCEETKSGSMTLLKKLEEQNKNKKSKKKDAENIGPPQRTGPALVRNKKFTSSVIRPLLAFLETLTECADDGRILMKYDKDAKNAGMKFVLLNPGGHFEEIINECRSIIIAGGTMQPTAEVVDQLFKSCRERVREHFYDHVVSPESILPFCVQKGPTGKKFLFNFSTRNNPELLHELGMTLQNICSVVPAGIVCFFGSYDYLDTVYSHLSKNGNLARLESKKYIFREPRSGTGHSVEKILSEFANCIRDPLKQGAILFSVVGGKLSEGLNFSDDLGRCIIVVGMPYPNKNSPELQEKMKYLDKSLGSGSGSEYYDNLCMKSVNQCIGRSIRHINDYACVLLLDERYAREQIKKKLPAWILKSLKIPVTFGMIQGSIGKFFRDKKKK